MPKTRSAKSRNGRGTGETSSSTASPSRQSPASSSTNPVRQFPLPAPATTRRNPPRMYATRSQSSRTSSRQASRSAASSRSGSILSSSVGNSERPAKRRRRAEQMPSAGETSSTSQPVDTSSNTSAPRPAWRNSDDEDENTDQLDDSEVEEIVTVEQDTSHSQSSNSGSASVRVVSEHTEPGPSTSIRHLSPTFTPLTTLSPTATDPVILDPLPTSTASSSAVVGPSSGAVSGSGLTGRPAPTPATHETPASPVSSPSLMKIINQTNISPGTVPSKRKRSLSPDLDIVEIFNLPSTSLKKDKGKGKAKAVSLSPTPPPTTTISITSQKGEVDIGKEQEPEPLSEYTCPICFFPPSNATLTPCGHVCCGSCLFTAVKTTLQRGQTMGMGMVGVGENVARCPVCRAVIPGWDGKGGGVIGLKVRQVISL